MESSGDRVSGTALFSVASEGLLTRHLHRKSADREEPGLPSRQREQQWERH